MLIKTTLVVSSKIYNVHVKISDNIKFDLEAEYRGKHCGGEKYVFHILNRVGDFKIVKVTDNFNTDLPDINYSEDINAFSFNYKNEAQTFYFYVKTDVEFKKIELEEKVVNVKLWIPYQNMQKLNVFEYYEDYVLLPQCENKKLIYQVKKIQKGRVRVVAGLPGDDQTIDFGDEPHTHECPDSTDCNITVSFIIDSSKMIPSENHSPENSSFSAPKNESFHDLNFFEILKDSKYSDVILIASDNTEIPSHRSILAKHSKIFDKIFDESTEIPVKINIDGFDADTISASLDFCYGNKNAIVDKEFKVFEFAEKYDINALKEACCEAFERNFCQENVFELVRIAYSHNFETLKEKCKKMLAENKGKLDPLKLKELPKNILIETFCL